MESVPFLYTGLKPQSLQRNIWDRHKRTKKNERGEKCLSLPIFPFQLPFNPFYSRLCFFFVFRSLFRLWFASQLMLCILEAFLNETMTYIAYWSQCIINEYLDLDKREVTVSLPSNSCRDFRTRVWKWQFNYGTSHQFFFCHSMVVSTLIIRLHN